MIIRSNRAKNEYRKRARYSCCFVLRRSYGRNPYGRNYARLHFQKKKWYRHRLTSWKTQGESVAMPDQELDQEFPEKEKKAKEKKREKYLPASCSFDSSISGIARQEVTREEEKEGPAEDTQIAAASLEEEGDIEREGEGQNNGVQDDGSQDGDFQDDGSLDCSFQNSDSQDGDSQNDGFQNDGSQNGGQYSDQNNPEAAKNGDDMEKDDITKIGEALKDNLEDKESTLNNSNNTSDAENSQAEENTGILKKTQETQAPAAAPAHAAGMDTEGDNEDHSDDPALLSAVEAILFAMGDSVQVSAIAKALDRSQEDIQHAADALQRRYDAGGSGLMIQHYDDALQLSTRPEQYQNLIRIAKVPRKITLSDAVIETLSIIAYRQPITKAEIEQIRGVSSDYAVNRLLEYDLIRELGRKEAPGKPILFGTTEQFLRTFGIQQLSDLPQLPPSAKEEFQEEAEAEIDSRLNV